jgi:hypothetical protein
MLGGVVSAWAHRPDNSPGEQAHLGGGSARVEIGQDDGQVLGVGKEAYDVGVIRPHPMS